MVAVDNLLLCLFNKLDFILGMYRKKQYIKCFRHPLGVLECSPMDKVGRLLSMGNMLMEAGRWTVEGSWTL